MLSPESIFFLCFLVPKSKIVAHDGCMEELIDETMKDGFDVTPSVLAGL